MEIRRRDARQIRPAKFASLETPRPPQECQGGVEIHRDQKCVGESSEKDVADAGTISPPAIPPSVANANALLASADAPADSARAMTAKANTMLLAAAAADKPVEAQAPDEAAVVASDELNDVDRALQQTASTQTVALAAAKPATPPQASGNDNSPWDQTSLIGKIFIAFGALLTMASAARMFMA